MADRELIPEPKRCRDCFVGEPHACLLLDGQARRLLAIEQRASDEYEALFSA